MMLKVKMNNKIKYYSDFLKRIKLTNSDLLECKLCLDLLNENQNNLIEKYLVVAYTSRQFFPSFSCLLHLAEAADSTLSFSIFPRTAVTTTVPSTFIVV